MSTLILASNQHNGITDAHLYLPRGGPVEVCRVAAGGSAGVTLELTFTGTKQARLKVPVRCYVRGS